MKITLRDRSYEAEHLTDLNYLPLGRLFIDKNGRFMVEGAEDYESLPQSTKNKLVQPLMDKLSDPDEKAAIAHALVSIFPSLPRELVRYSGKGDFAMNLNLTELMTVAIAVGNALQGVKGKSQEIESRIEQLTEAAETLRSQGKGFAAVAIDLEIERVRQLATSTQTEF